MAQCEALTKKGARCRGGAMPGSPFCGPHQGTEVTPDHYKQLAEHHYGEARRIVRRIKVPQGMIECPECGKVVHKAGELVSYHPPCPVWEIKKERAWPVP